MACDTLYPLIPLRLLAVNPPGTAHPLAASPLAGVIEHRYMQIAEEESLTDDEGPFMKIAAARSRAGNVTYVK